MNRSVAFPSRLFRWFLTKQIFLGLLSLVVLEVLIWFGLENYADLTSEARWVGRSTILISLASATVVMIAISVFMARRLVVPLGRLIEKTRRLHHYPFDSDDPDLAGMDYDEPGEWYDLERALNELGRDLRQKTIRLSREKTELRTIMSALNEGVLAINQERRPLFYNTQFALSFGLSGDGLDSMRVEEILRSPDVLAAYRDCLRDGVIQQVVAQLELRGGDQPRSFQVSLAPLRKKHNQEIYGAVAVFNDITEIKKAEKMRIEFVGNVSHELRTPLTAIKGYLQTAIQEVRAGKTEQTGEYLAVVDRNVERLMRLVDDLLNLSALQAGVVLKRSRLDLKALTEEVMAQVDTRAHSIEIDLDVTEMWADEERVELVLRNLLQNAVRYVPKGGRIQIRWVKSNAHGVGLHVADNGPGIALEHQARLFERFYRIDEARSRAVGGSGIGLALVKHVMQRHGGQVRIVSQPGQGAEFICEFPGARIERAGAFRARSPEAESVP